MAGRKRVDPAEELSPPRRRGSKRAFVAPVPEAHPDAKKIKKKIEEKKKEDRRTVKDGPGSVSASPEPQAGRTTFNGDLGARETRQLKEKYFDEVLELYKGQRLRPSSKKLENGLTLSENLFVEAYCRDPNGSHIDVLVNAGYRPASVASAESTYRRLLAKPEIEAAISQKMRSWRDILDGQSRKLVKLVFELATFDIKDIFEVEGGKVTVKDTATMPFAARNMIKTIKQTHKSKGGDEITVTTDSRQDYLNKCLAWLGLLDKQNACKALPHPEQVQALDDILAGQKTPAEAALGLEKEGVPLPETLRLLLAQPQIQVGVNQETTIEIPTPEEIAAKRARLLEEVEAERNVFLPERQEDVRQIKAQIGAVNQAFSADKDGNLES